jgi:hypothetical protein
MPFDHRIKLSPLLFGARNKVVELGRWRLTAVEAALAMSPLTEYSFDQ